MAGLPLTKNALRQEQIKLGHLQKYLPTLQLKKAMLQMQANEVRQVLLVLKQELQHAEVQAKNAKGLFNEEMGVPLVQILKVKTFHKRYENIAGVELPFFDVLEFEPLHYSLLETPLWLETVIDAIHKEEELKLRVLVEEEKMKAIEKELKEVSVRVNLFEKVLIPRAEMNIKHIAIFLADQQLAAVCRAKVAKKKIEERNEALCESM